MRYFFTLKSFLFIFFACQIGSAQQNYILSDLSELTVQGTSTVHDWTMELTKMAGSLTLEDGITKKILFEAKVADLQSERGATMDNKAKEALKYKEHPRITFEGVQGSLHQTENGTYTLTGTLTFAGSAKKISIPVKITKGPEYIKLQGNQQITLQDFNIVPPTAMFGSIVVGDLITVHFDLLYQKQIGKQSTTSGQAREASGEN